MKPILLALAAFSLFAVLPAAALEPAYTGEFGNPEEPALRPYKWMWRGSKAVVYHPVNSFVRGNMNLPVIGTVETGRGLRRGTFELFESAYRGMNGAPIPAKDHAHPRDSFKDLSRINGFLEEEWLLGPVSDALFTAVLFPLCIPLPLQYTVDHCPAETDEQVQIRLDRAKATREARAAATRNRNMLPDTPVERAQKKYIGERATVNQRKEASGTGNLLKAVNK